MNIAVIAADGRLGRTFVDEALKAGHTVRAGVHHLPTSLPNHPKLEIQQCDATDKKQVSQLLKDQEVVVSCLGHVKDSAHDVQTVATEVIITEMQRQGIRRFVDLTGTGARVVGDKIPLLDYLLNLVVSVMDPFRVLDGKHHLKLLQESDLEWTTIRVLKLQEVRAHAYKLKLHGPTKWYVGRTEAARAMLEVIEKHSYIGKAPIIGYRFS